MVAICWPRRGLRRSQPGQQLDLGLLASRTVRKLTFVVLRHPVCVFCHDSPHYPKQLVMGIDQSSPLLGCSQAAHSCRGKGSQGSGEGSQQDGHHEVRQRCHSQMDLLDASPQTLTMTSTLQFSPRELLQFTLLGVWVLPQLLLHLVCPLVSTEYQSYFNSDNNFTSKFL